MATGRGDQLRFQSVFGEARNSSEGPVVGQDVVRLPALLFERPLDLLAGRSTSGVQPRLASSRARRISGERVDEDHESQSVSQPAS